MKISELMEKATSDMFDVVKHKLLDNGEYGLGQLVLANVPKSTADAKKSEIKTELEKEGFLVRVIPHNSGVREK